MSLWRLSCFHAILMGAIFLWHPKLAYSLDLDAMGGLFSLQAKTASAEGSKSNLGTYRVGLSQPLINNFEASIGYTLMVSEIFSGDLSYGFDFGVHYFLPQASGDVSVATESVQVKSKSLWKPYLGMGFSQRQFQSVRTNYAGFSLSAGVIKAYTSEFSLKGELRYVSLSGPNSSEGTEITIVGGIRIGL